MSPHKTPNSHNDAQKYGSSRRDGPPLRTNITRSDNPHGQTSRPTPTELARSHQGSSRPQDSGIHQSSRPQSGYNSSLQSGYSSRAPVSPSSRHPEASRTNQSSSNSRRDTSSHKPSGFSSSSQVGSSSRPPATSSHRYGSSSQTKKSTDRDPQSQSTGSAPSNSVPTLSYRIQRRIEVNSYVDDLPSQANSEIRERGRYGSGGATGNNISHSALTEALKASDAERARELAAMIQDPNFGERGLYGSAMRYPLRYPLWHRFFETELILERLSPFTTISEPVPDYLALVPGFPTSSLDTDSKTLLQEYEILAACLQVAPGDASASIMDQIIRQNPLLFPIHTRYGKQLNKGLYASFARLLWKYC